MTADRPISNLLSLIKAVKALETADVVWVELHLDGSGEMIAGEDGFSVVLFNFENSEEMFYTGADWIQSRLKGEK